MKETDLHFTVIYLKSGKYKVPVKKALHGGYIYFSFGFNEKIRMEIKSMKGQHWCGFDKVPMKLWRVDLCERNYFQLAYLAGENPYAIYDKKLPKMVSGRPLMSHQFEMLAHAWTRYCSILACEMGTGKTLVAIELMERVGGKVWIFGPKSAVRAIGYELEKWKSTVEPEVRATYNKLTSIMQEGIDDKDIPDVLIFDESSLIKNITAQRTKAALMLADLVRDKGGYVLLMSGTPAPKSPVDWWAQCEIASPGFLKEGQPTTLRRTLCIEEMRDNPQTGGQYPQLLSWKDDSQKCNVCGEYAHDLKHSPTYGQSWHKFEASINEVERLYKRMDGLVLVKYKKDCMDLPEIVFEERILTPTVELLQTARTIAKVSTRAVTALTLTRELSDGFQYIQEAGDEIECPACHGVCELESPEGLIECPNCSGEGVILSQHRSATRFEVPKDAELRMDLDAHSECGRLIVWAGFKESIDKVTSLCINEGWTVLRLDGRGSQVFEKASDNPFPPEADEAYKNMDLSTGINTIKRLVVVANPGAGSMAVTFTASPTEIFYSNTFNAGDREQAIARGHRAGMDINRGLKIIDYIQLPTDRLVLTNLQKKQRLQAITMGAIKEALLGETNRA
jgi:hypothetical protein